MCVELGHLRLGPVEILNGLEKRHEVHRHRPFPSTGLDHGVENGDVQRPGAIAEDEPVTPCLPIVPLNLLHGPQAVQHVLMTVFFKRAVERLVVGEQKIQGLRL